MIHPNKQIMRALLRVVKSLQMQHHIQSLRKKKFFSEAFKITGNVTTQSNGKCLHIYVVYEYLFSGDTNKLCYKSSYLQTFPNIRWKCFLSGSARLHSLTYSKLTSIGNVSWAGLSSSDNKCVWRNLVVLPRSKFLWDHTELTVFPLDRSFALANAGTCASLL